MPRPILVPTGTAGIATYTLSAHDEFTLIAVTVTVDGSASMGGDNFAFLDIRDPANGIIHLQPLAPADGGVMFYSLAPGASEFLAENNGGVFWPQQSGEPSQQYVSQSLAPLTLYAGCSVNVYKPFGLEAPPTDPITAVNPLYVIDGMHLWVEDVPAAAIGPTVVGPWRLVGGLNA